MFTKNSTNPPSQPVRARIKLGSSIKSAEAPTADAHSQLVESKSVQTLPLRFFVHAAVAKKYRQHWPEISERKAAPDSWHKDEAWKPSYPLSIFTVWLCIEYGILSLDNDLMFKKLNLAEWTGESPADIAELPNIPLTANAIRVWKLWGMPRPHTLQALAGKSEPVLVDFLVAAMKELGLPVYTRTENNLTTIALDIRELLRLEQEAWRGNTSSSRYVFGSHLAHVQEVCDREVDLNTEPEESPSSLAKTEMGLLVLKTLKQRVDSQEHVIQSMQEEMRTLREELRKRDASECEHEEVEVFGIGDSRDSKRDAKRLKPAGDNEKMCPLM